MEFYAYEKGQYHPKHVVFETTYSHDLGPDGGHATERHRFNLDDGKVEHSFGFDYGYGDLSDFADSLCLVDRVETKEDALAFVEREKQAALERLVKLDELLESLKSSEFQTTADYSELDEFEDEDYDEEE